MSHHEDPTDAPSWTPESETRAQLRDITVESFTYRTGEADAPRQLRCDEPGHDVVFYEGSVDASDEAWLQADSGLVVERGEMQ